LPGCSPSLDLGVAPRRRIDRYLEYLLLSRIMEAGIYSGDSGVTSCYLMKLAMSEAGIPDAETT